MSGIIGDNTGRGTGLIKAAGGGKLLQVLETTDEDIISINGTSPTASGLLQAITPTAASSKILVTYWSGTQGNGNNGWSFVYFDVAGGGYARRKPPNSNAPKRPSATSRKLTSGVTFGPDSTLLIDLTYGLSMK